ncbi:MAG TPA: hypothetical protein QGH10_06995, partial [Armatimonadota bacterium]|nr:hypothetical protein [Armatimonadota bacterium]
MEVYFTVQGRRIVGTKEQVEVALRGVRPERVRVHGVTVGTETYPVTQALATAFDLPRKACAPHVARRVLGRLGFKLSETGNRPKRRGTRKRMHEALPDRRYELGPVEDEFFALPRIHLAWSRWERWEDIDEHSVAILDMPLCKSGVYEAKQSDNEARLTIGRASDLRTRILNG